jgi:hypothetical protein
VLAGADHDGAVRGGRTVSAQYVRIGISLVKISFNQRLIPCKKMCNMEF